jgi:hypothetical protein
MLYSPPKPPLLSPPTSPLDFQANRSTSTGSAPSASMFALPPSALPVAPPSTSTGTRRAPPPYPLPYTPQILELESLVTQTLLHHPHTSSSSPTSASFPTTATPHPIDPSTPSSILFPSSNTFLSLSPADPQPRRILDLGCGGGSWILKQAQEWRESSFVGFDLPGSKQPDLEMLAEMQAEIREELGEEAFGHSAADGKGERCRGELDWKEMSERVEWVMGDLYVPVSSHSSLRIRRRD